MAYMIDRVTSGLHDLVLWASRSGSKRVWKIWTNKYDEGLFYLMLETTTKSGREVSVSRRFSIMDYLCLVDIFGFTVKSMITEIMEAENNSDDM